jgi:hypothetical protein
MVEKKREAAESASSESEFGDRTMKRLWMGCLGLSLSLLAREVRADDLKWQPVGVPAATPSNFGVQLFAPEPVSQNTSTGPSQNTSTRIVRAQIPDPAFGPPPLAPMPPPPPPPPPPIGLPANAPGDEKYNCAVRANSGSGPGFFDQTRDTVTGIPQSIGGIFQTDGNRALFQSDHCFDYFCSPVSNPFYDLDPRSLTEVKPLVIYQRVPGSNPNFLGGNIWFYGLQGSVAINDIFSVAIEKLGAVTFDPQSTKNGISNSTGFAEFMLGPKFTFFRCEATKTVVAAGLNFDLAIGNEKVFQGTGDLSLIPYISVAQNFLKSSYGSFNVMNSTGYSFATDNQRTDFFYNALHLDYDVLNFGKIYPLVELNWFHYTTNGNKPSTFGFEGADLANFGSGDIAGHDNLRIAVGARYKFAEWLQTGFVAEFPLIKDHDLMMYRLGFDLIFRY